eukprot:6172818-Pleurochrysis_carterae.AAC.5
MIPGRPPSVASARVVVMGGGGVATSPHAKRSKRPRARARSQTRPLMRFCDDVPMYAISACGPHML